MHNIAISDKLRGAIWGELIGDIAEPNRAWQEELRGLKFAYPTGIQGFEKPAPSAGSNDHASYETAAFLMLKSIAKCRGFSAIDFGTSFLETFSSPACKEYLDPATKGTIKNYQDFLAEHPDLLIPFEFQDGADDDLISTATRIAPVIISHWQDPDLMRIVESATIVTQNNETAIAYMQTHARVTKSLLEGFDLSTAFEKETLIQSHDSPIEKKVRKKILEAIQLSNQSVIDATIKLGQTSDLDQAFPAAVHATLRFRDSFPEAILETIMGGGDCAARAALVGTWLGAYLGVDSIPVTWKEKLKHQSEIDHYIEEIVHMSVT